MGDQKPERGRALKIKRSNAVVPRNLGKLIKGRGEKAYEVAQRAGYSRQQMYDMLIGRRIIKPVDILHLAGALEIDPGELLRVE